MKSNNLLPILTSLSGTCITGKNWGEIGVKRGSFYLTALLIKPGLAYLKSLPDWKKQGGWEGGWVLNATMSSKPVSGEYQFRSPYDGSRITCNKEDIVELTHHLKPSMVLLPEGFSIDSDETWHEMSQHAQLLVHINDKVSQPSRPVSGIYYVCLQMQEVIDRIDKHRMNDNDLECYIVCSFPVSPAESRWLSSLSLDKVSIELDSPAEDGYNGRVYCGEDYIDLRESKYKMQFEPIDPNCQCPTCEQQFTRAYLHHLLEHTPLLCHRLLIQHNWHLRENEFSL